MLTPPYSLTLSDYTKPGSQQLVVTIQVRDLMVTNLPVRLHLKMETTAGVSIETLPNLATVPLFLSGGEINVLFGDDLKDYFNIDNLNFRGYSKEQYLRTGQLPEGFYRFTVEVRHFATGRLISNRGSVTAWIAQGKPPTLKLPEDKTEQGEIAGMPLTFSWIPSNTGIPTGGLQYTLEIWEMRVPGIDPYVVAASMPVFYSSTQFTNTLVVQPAELMLEPGLTYAWRVTVSDAMRQLSFFNDGHSEIRTFTYQCKCNDITNFTVERQSNNAIFRWNPAVNHTAFEVEMENPASGWKSNSRTFDSRYTIPNIDPGKTYRMRVRTICNSNEQTKSEFTEWKSMTIPEPQKREDYCPECKCGDAEPEPEITNFNLRNDLQPGDTIHSPSGNSKYILKTVNSLGNDRYKGQFLFWIRIWNIKVLCDYWDLSVNTDNQIVTMAFESVYDPQFLLDVDGITENLNETADALATLTTNTNIRDTVTINTPINDIYTNPNGQVTVVNGDGTETVLTNHFNRTLIQDPAGNEYVALSDGTVMGKDEFEATGGNDRLIDNYNKEKEAQAQPSVIFSASADQKYGFDAYTEIRSAIQNEYPELKPGYRPPFKSLISFGTDKVEAKNADKAITFRTEMGIPAQKDGTTLSIRGGSDGEETALYAYHKQDTTETIAGKLDLLSFDEQVRKVYLVSVNGAKLPSTSALQEELNRIYAPALTRWEVAQAKAINVIFPD
ncbi:MAG: hypothetical protein LBC40_08985, partial [Dysgonamonadaceae bacterium]|nr:hypothetical protein [Dysgonamonadaceae bacterium]